MTWQESQKNTLRTWHAIRDAIGTAHPLDLLVEMNVVMDLCEKAEEEAGGHWNRCEHCLLQQQHGNCREISARMSELAASREWDELRRLVEEFIRRLEFLQLPGFVAT
jgi:hypothetical protein